MLGNQDVILLGKREVGSTSVAATSRSSSSPAASETTSTSAKLLRAGGNLLLLDEPTNDLDVDTLRGARGGPRPPSPSATRSVFLDRIATHILAFEGDSQTTWFEGSCREFEDWGPRQHRAAPHRVQVGLAEPLTVGAGRRSEPDRCQTCRVSSRPQDDSLHPRCGHESHSECLVATALRDSNRCLILERAPRGLRGSLVDFSAWSASRARPTRARRSPARLGSGSGRLRRSPSVTFGVPGCSPGADAVHDGAGLRRESSRTTPCRARHVGAAPTRAASSGRLCGRHRSSLPPCRTGSARRSSSSRSSGHHVARTVARRARPRLHWWSWPNRLRTTPCAQEVRSTSRPEERARSVSYFVVAAILLSKFGDCLGWSCSSASRSS